MARQFKQFRRILLIRLGGLGDVVFTLPAVNAVRTAFPNAHITFLVYAEYAPLLEGFHQVDAVVPLDRKEYRTWNATRVVSAAAALVWQLRRNAFDVVVDLQGFGETGLLAWLSGAPLRWGSVYRPGREWAYTRAVRRDTSTHPIEGHLEVLRRGGIIEMPPPQNQFKLPDHALRAAEIFFSRHGLDPKRPTLFIQPFTNGEHKNWRLDGYVEIARQWQQRGLQVLFGGGPAERELLEPVRRVGFVVAAGAPLMVSAGLVALSTVVLGGDTGLLHLATAMGKRVVMLMCSTSPGNCLPYAHPDWVVVPETGRRASFIRFEATRAACEQALAQAGAFPWPAARPGVDSICASEKTYRAPVSLSHSR